MYLQQFDKYIFPFSCLGQGLNPEPFSTVSSALPSEPSHLSKGVQYYSYLRNLNYVSKNCAINHLNYFKERDDKSSSKKIIAIINTLLNHAKH